MFEIANARELRLLALDASPPVQDEAAVEEVQPAEPSEEDRAMSPRHWPCLWSID